MESPPYRLLGHTSGQRAPPSPHLVRKHPFPTLSGSTPPSPCAKAKKNNIKDSSWLEEELPRILDNLTFKQHNFISLILREDRQGKHLDMLKTSEKTMLGMMCLSRRETLSEELARTWTNQGLSTLRGFVRGQDDKRVTCIENYGKLTLFWILSKHISRDI